MLDIARVMSELASDRPVFHSEADFQHAFAWHIHSLMPNGKVRLEYRPLPDEAVYLDLWFPAIGVVVELKYYTRELKLEHDSELFSLRNQAAMPPRRYDFLKDIQRLERVCRKRRDIRTGFAVLLTNDYLYWTQSARDNVVDADFCLYAGRLVAGEMDWSMGAADGTKRGREKPICLAGSYELQWRDYPAEIGDARHGQFRYLAVQVSPLGCGGLAPE